MIKTNDLMNITINHVDNRCSQVKLFYNEMLNASFDLIQEPGLKIFIEFIIDNKEKTSLKILLNPKTILSK